ncbi:MAG: hypothetical protein GY888_01295, partial [Planctomycetaceae bacterium]|nr:hypothetical protein [Planctomycetaceae bacterium]
DVSLQYQAAVGHLLQSVSPLHVTTNSITGGYPLGQNASNSQWFVNNDPSVENKSSTTDSVFDGFTTVLTGSWEGIGAGTHTIHLTVSDVLDPLSNDSALFVLAGGVSTQPLECEDLLGQPLGRRFDFIGHENTARTQGQLLIESNSISRSLNHGLVLDSTFDDDGSGRTYPGGPRNLREINHAGLVPGVAVYNNTLAFNQLGGIQITGEATGGGGQPTVRFDRIVNNTIYGTGPAATVDHDNDPATPALTNTGITVQGNASPTIINNILANSGVGIEVENNEHANTTVLGANLYANNDVDSAPHPTLGLGENAVTVESNEPLFVSPATDNFYLEQGSPAIDNSIKSLRERSSLTAVKEPMGIAPSPVLAPELDGIGQLRVDDPLSDTNSGVGEDVFADIGAIDRVDNYGPWTVLINPVDWIGVD